MEMQREPTGLKWKVEWLWLCRPPLLLGRACRAPAQGFSLVTRRFCSRMHAFLVPVEQEWQHLKPSTFLKGMSVSCREYYGHSLGLCNLNIYLTGVNV